MKQQVKISKVKGNPSNPRIIKNDKFKKLVKSIKEFPEMLKLRPIVVDEDFMVLGGNMRLKASKEAGLSDVWIDVAEGLTEEQKKEFIVKDNVGFGEWEWDILANEWDSVQLAEWGLDVWENEDDKVTEGLIDDYEIPEVKESIVKRGDIWQLGEHRVMCGDSTSSDDVEKLMNGEKADMVFTDPPYGINYSSKNSGYKTSNNFDVIKNDENGVDLNLVFSFDCIKVIFGANCFPSKLPHRGRWLVWYKRGDGAEKALGSPFELAWIDTESGFDRFYKVVHGGFVNSDGGKRLHPTQKPVKLFVSILDDLAENKNNIVDLFLGSGTTLLACEKTNRKCYGMELDEKYCDVIINRWEQFTGLKATIINGTK